MNAAVAALLLIIGAGIVVFWLLHWLSGKLPQGLSTVDSGSYIAFHILAELITAGLAVTAGIVTLFHGFPLSSPWVFLTACALVYTGFNSLGWSVRKQDNRFIVIFIITVALGIYLAWYAQFGWHNFL